MSTVTRIGVRLVQRRISNLPLVPAIIVTATTLVVIMSLVLPPAVDWSTVFRPAARELALGRSPYGIRGFFNPPWALLPLVPLALLPESVGRAALVAVSLAALAYTAYRLGAKPPTMALLLSSPPVLHGLLNGSLDWLAVLGFVLPPRLGLFFVVVKPQVGVAVALYWLAEAWREGGWRKALHVFWPVTAALLLSVTVFGPWPLLGARTVRQWWNASLWPMSIPVGLALLIAAIRKRKAEYAIAASPCLSPYVLLHSWAGPLLALSGSLTEAAATVAGLWILVGIRAFG